MDAYTLGALAALVVGIALFVTIPWAVAYVARGGKADAELALAERRVAELELEVATLEAQAEAGHDAAGDLVLVERKLAEVRARAGGDRAARRLGLLRAGAGDGGAPAAPARAAGGPDGAPHGPAGPVA